MKQPIVLLEAAARRLAVCGLTSVLIVCAAIGAAAASKAPSQQTDPTAADQGSVSRPAEKSAPATPQGEAAESGSASRPAGEPEPPSLDYWSMLFVFVLATFIGIGVIRRVSRLLHTPLMSLTNAISAIAVVGSIIVTGADYPADYPYASEIRILGAIALFASTTNIVSGFLITDRMLKMFKTPSGGGK